MKKKDPKPEIFSEETCQSCGEKIRRSFEEGDYVFRAGSPCKKCSSDTIISSIYGEYPPEKQEKN
jgi:hypothetical protein